MARTKHTARMSTGGQVPQKLLGSNSGPRMSQLMKSTKASATPPKRRASSKLTVVTASADDDMDVTIDTLTRQREAEKARIEELEHERDAALEDRDKVEHIIEQAKKVASFDAKVGWKEFVGAIDELKEAIATYEEFAEARVKAEGDVGDAVVNPDTLW